MSAAGTSRNDCWGWMSKWVKVESQKLGFKLPCMKCSNCHYKIALDKEDDIYHYLSIVTDNIILCNNYHRDLAEHYDINGESQGK